MPKSRLTSEQRSMLDARLKNATVQKQDDGNYGVFIQGGRPEYTVVEAANKAEALQKVRAHQLNKLEHIARKAAASGSGPAITVADAVLGTSSDTEARNG